MAGDNRPLAVEAIAADCDLDWILLDMEHGGAGWEDLKMVMLGWKWSDVPIFIRPPSHDQKFLMAALDLGVSGFVVPFVNSPEDARRVAEACRYPPMGIRGSAPRRVSRHYTLTDEYKASADDDVFVMVQIEHKNAVECVEEIAAVPGIDALFIGPGDLSYSYTACPSSSTTRPSWTPSRRSWTRAGPRASRSPWRSTARRKRCCSASSRASSLSRWASTGCSCGTPSRSRRPRCGRCCSGTSGDNEQ